MKCYSTYRLGKGIEKNPIMVNGKEKNFTQQSNAVTAGKGLVNEYDGSGFIIDTILNKSNSHFFRDMF